MLELRLRLGVPSQGCVGVVAGRHRLLESLQLRLDRDEVGRPGEHALAQRQAALQRWALVMERDARPLLKSQFAALDAGLAGERPEQRRLAGAVRSGQRDAVAPLDLERHAVEERVAGELLPDVRCDQDGHGYSVERTQGSTASPPKTIMVTRSAAGLNARIAVASVLLALVVMGAFGLMVSTIQDLRSSSRTALASEQVVATANRLEKLALDLETGQRGYALTGEEAFLAPFRRAAQQVPAVSRRLEQLVRHDPARLDRVRELEARITSYRRDWADPLIAAERRNPHAARHLLSTGRGKQRMDAIRARFSTFVGAEQQLAARHADRSDDGGRGAILIGLGAVGGSALLILVYATYLFRVVTIPVRRVAEGARRLAGGALSTRVPERGVGEVGALAGDFNAMADSLGRQSAQLQRQNAELEAVLDATIDGILMTDAEGTLLFSNKKIERFWSELGLPDEGTIWDRLVRLAQCTTTP